MEVAATKPVGVAVEVVHAGLGQHRVVNNLVLAQGQTSVEDKHELRLSLAERQAGVGGVGVGLGLLEGHS